MDCLGIFHVKMYPKGCCIVLSYHKRMRVQNVFTHCTLDMISQDILNYPHLLIQSRSRQVWESPWYWWVNYRWCPQTAVEHIGPLYACTASLTLQIMHWKKFWPPNGWWKTYWPMLILKMNFSICLVSKYICWKCMWLSGSHAFIMSYSWWVFWLGAGRQQAITSTNVDLVLWSCMTSKGHIELTNTVHSPSYQSLYSLCRLTSFCRILWSLEVKRFRFRLFQSLWNSTSFSAAAPPRCLSNFRVMWSL